MITRITPRTATDFSSYLADLEFTKIANSKTIPRLVRAHHAQERTRQQLGYPANRVDNVEELRHNDVERCRRYDQQMQLLAARSDCNTLLKGFIYATTLGFGNCGEHSIVSFYNLSEAFLDHLDSDSNRSEIYRLSHSREGADHNFNKVKFLEEDESIIVDSWKDGHPVLEQHYTLLEKTVKVENMERSSKSELVDKKNRIAAKARYIDFAMKKIEKKYKQLEEKVGFVEHHYYDMQMPNLDRSKINAETQQRERQIVERMGEYDLVDPVESQKKFKVLRELKALKIAMDNDIHHTNENIFLQDN